METSEPGDIRDTGMPTRRNTTPPIGRQQCIPIMPPLSPDPGLTRLTVIAAASSPVSNRVS